MRSGRHGYRDIWTEPQNLIYGQPKGLFGITVRSELFLNTHENAFVRERLHRFSFAAGAETSRKSCWSTQLHVVIHFRPSSRSHLRPHSGLRLFPNLSQFLDLVPLGEYGDILRSRKRTSPTLCGLPPSHRRLSQRRAHPVLARCTRDPHVKGVRVFHASVCAPRQASSDRAVWPTV